MFKWLSLLGISLYCSNITITYSLNMLLMVDRFLFSIQSEMRGCSSKGLRSQNDIVFKGQGQNTHNLFI